MRGVVALLVALLSTTVLSGCFVEADDDPETSGTSGTVSGTSTGTAASGGTRSGSASATGTTGPGANATNRAPTADLTASVSNGTAPLNVTFDLAGSDPDGDALTWTLTSGNTTLGNGTALPANVTHAFTQGGNHTVVLVVSDGRLNATANVTVVLAAGAAGFQPVTHKFTGTLLGLANPATGAMITGSIKEHKFAVPAGASQIHFMLIWSPHAPGAADLDLYIDDPTGKERGSSACANLSPVPGDGIFTCTRAGSEETTITGLSAADAGEWVAAIVPYQAPNVSYTLTIKVT